MIRWSHVVAQIRPGDELRPLAGGSRLVVESIDQDEMCLRQRLWRACLTRPDLETGSEILAGSPAGTTPIELAERIRAHFTSGFDLKTECTRVPNLAAIVLYNMGAVGELSCTADRRIPPEPVEPLRPITRPEIEAADVPVQP